MKARRKFGPAAAAIAALMILASCSEPVEPIEYVKVSRSSTYSGSGDAVEPVSTSGYVDLTYTLDGLTGQDVYFVFTNTSTSATVSNPVVGNTAARHVAAPPRSRSLVQPRVTREPSHVREFNNNPPAFGRGKTWDTAASAVASGPSRAWVAGNTKSGGMFDDTGATIAVTVRDVLTTLTADGDVHVVLWVADSDWDATGTVSGKVWPSMLTALRNKFLLDGLDNDIYDWVTQIFGVPWGPQSFPNLITVTSPPEVHVVLYDIDGDGAPVAGNAYTVGFFYARDNFVQTSNGSVTDKSNELVMFYMDSKLFADDENDDGWLLTDYWPQILVSTLAHEFQHMIHFYQKQVVWNTGSTQTWLNEMCSMVSEDLVAFEMQVNGPRGVTYSNGGAGAAGNVAGRLPYFNLYNDIPVTQWSSSDPLASYSINYALGAYLARTYDGGAFFRDVVQSANTGPGAIEYALGQNGGAGLTFADILQRWGASVLLSDNALDPPTDLQYNTGDFVYDTLGFRLGSINLFNYSYGSLDGPWLYAAADLIGYGQGHLPASNLYYEAALAANAPMTWNIRMDTGVRLTVVIKEP